MKVDVKKIAKLAHIPVTNDQISQLEKELSSIITFIDTLKKIDTSSVEPTNQVTGLTHVVRADRVEFDTILNPQEALSNVVDYDNNYFVVKAVFDNNDNS